MQIHTINGKHKIIIRMYTLSIQTNQIYYNKYTQLLKRKCFSFVFFRKYWKILKNTKNTLSDIRQKRGSIFKMKALDIGFNISTTFHFSIYSLPSKNILRLNTLLLRICWVWWKYTERQNMLPYKNLDMVWHI